MNWDTKNEEMYYVTVFAKDLSEFMSTSFRSYVHHTYISCTERGQTDGQTDRQIDRQINRQT